MSTNLFAHGDLGNRYRTLSFEEASDPVLDQPDLIHGVLPAAGVGCIHGSSLHSARLFALDIALTIGSEATSWHGMRVGGGKVVYFCRDAHSATVRNHVAAFKREKSKSPNFYLGLMRSEGAPHLADIPTHASAVFFEVPVSMSNHAFDAEPLSADLGCLVVIVSRERYQFCDVRIRVDDGCAEIDNLERSKIPITTKHVDLGTNRFGELVQSEVIKEPSIDVEACLARFEELAEEGRPARESAQAKQWAGHVIAEIYGLDTNDTGNKQTVHGILDNWKMSGIVEVRRWKNPADRKFRNCIYRGAEKHAEF